MVEVNPVGVQGVNAPNVRVSDDAQIAGDTKGTTHRREQAISASGVPVAPETLEKAASEVEKVVNSVTNDTSLSFRIEEDLSRMVVAVRAVGSDEIIRQFPPEEFITVAKHIAAQNPDMMDEDYLKGVLFDQYS
jgi:uncharacterized FlaG/YvyC family protein